MSMWVVLGDYIRLEFDNYHISIGPSGIVLFLPRQNLKERVVQFLVDELGANANDKVVQVILTPIKVRNLVGKLDQLRNLNLLATLLDALLSTDTHLINEAVDNILQLETA